jgi:methylglyoxal synthase/DNA-binding transcriptional regulator LsrR (DeoR family)
MVASGESAAVVLLLDPSDPWSDAVENRALRRVCIQRQVRLMTTYAAALRWAVFEAAKAVPTKDDTWRPKNWREGRSNVTERGDLQQLPISARSLALISHDGKKLEMVRFVNTYSKLLALHDRILTTGTTGWVLKLLYAGKASFDDLALQAVQEGRTKRLCDVSEALIGEMGFRPKERAGLGELLGQLREQSGAIEDEEFAAKVMPLPSGPEGGDVLIANAVLDNQCHTILFFHDPMRSHPHNDDIRLLEHTSQIRGVFAECVSDRQSAEKWIEGLDKEAARPDDSTTLAQKLRTKFNLTEAVLVPLRTDDDCDELGTALARACAGFFNHKLTLQAMRTVALRIGIAWGWGTKNVLEALKQMQREGLLVIPPRLSESVRWSPLIGTITAEVTDREASSIAQGFCDFYGGSVEAFPCAGFARRGATMPPHVSRLIEVLENADIILTSGSPWDETAALYKNTGLDHKHFPEISEDIGLVSGVFLDQNGKEREGEYTIVGLGYEGFRKAARHGAVILMCGGLKRRNVLRAALRGQLASVVITSTKTAEWIVADNLEARDSTVGQLAPTPHSLRESDDLGPRP